MSIFTDWDYANRESKQLERAIEQLQNLQKQRKNEGSMGSFGQSLDCSVHIAAKESGT
jgi:hypothetical protein